MVIWKLRKNSCYIRNDFIPPAKRQHSRERVDHASKRGENDADKRMYIGPTDSGAGDNPQDGSRSCEMEAESPPVDSISDEGCQNDRQDY